LRLLVEKDFVENNEKVTIGMNVFDLTIAANYRGDISPSELVYCLKICFFTFFFQVSICFFFAWDYLSLENFQPLYPRETLLRLFASLLMHQEAFMDYTKSMRMLTLLKRLPSTANSSQGRIMNLVLVSMQILIPVC